MFCRNCGREIDDNADVCVNCGKLVKEKPQQEESILKKGWFLAILCFFVGCFGIHRFVVGKIGTGVLWLLTLGIFGFGALIDFIMILCGTFKDKDGNKISFGA